MAEMIKPPMLRSQRDGSYELWLDSPLGYEPQGLFDNKREADEHVEWLYLIYDGTPSLWQQPLFAHVHPHPDTKGA